MKQKAINRISMAHCLSTIVNADKILVLENRQLVEEGTHKKLMEKRGIYWELYSREQHVN